MTDQIEKLKKYIEYWNEHNTSHLEKLNSRVEMAVEIGLTEVANQMKVAVGFMKKANEALLEAYDLI